MQKQSSLTPDEAVRRGVWLINVPVSLMLFGIPALTVIGYGQHILSVSLALTIAVSGFFLAWLYWSIGITHWKIWAFANVRNVHELKRKSIARQIVWHDDSWFSKTEIWSSANRERWKALQPKFALKDEYPELNLLPTETLLYYSRQKLRWMLFFYAILLIIGGLGLCWLGHYLIGAIHATVFSWSLLGYLRKYYNPAPQLIIGDKGIEFSNKEVYTWAAIRDISIESEGSGLNHQNILQFERRNDGEIIDKQVDFLTCEIEEIERLLTLYRIRGKRMNITNK